MRESIHFKLVISNKFNSITYINIHNNKRLSHLLFPGIWNPDLIKRLIMSITLNYIEHKLDEGYVHLNRYIPDNNDVIVIDVNLIDRGTLIISGYTIYNDKITNYETYEFLHSYISDYSIAEYVQDYFDDMSDIIKHNIRFGVV